MKNLEMRFVLLISFCFLVVVPVESSAAGQEITKDDAIAIAEKLIATNGAQIYCQ
jgi:hypothetical protein